MKLNEECGLRKSIYEALKSISGLSGSGAARGHLHNALQQVEALYRDGGLFKIEELLPELPLATESVEMLELLGYATGWDDALAGKPPTTIRYEVSRGRQGMAPWMRGWSRGYQEARKCAWLHANPVHGKGF